MKEVSLEKVINPQFLVRQKAEANIYSAISDASIGLGLLALIVKEATPQGIDSPIYLLFLLPIAFGAIIGNLSTEIFERSSATN